MVHEIELVIDSEAGWFSHSVGDKHNRDALKLHAPCWQQTTAHTRMLRGAERLWGQPWYVFSTGKVHSALQEKVSHPFSWKQTSLEIRLFILILALSWFVWSNKTVSLLWPYLGSVQFSVYMPVPMLQVPSYPFWAELQVVVAEISPYEMVQSFKTIHTSSVVFCGTGNRCDFQYAESAAASLLDNISQVASIAEIILCLS